MANIVLPGGPDIKYQVMDFGIERADGVLEFVGGGTQVTVFAKGNWAGHVTLPPLKGDDARLWTSALAQLSALENDCYIVPPDYRTPAYGGSPPLVKGASQLGASLNCDGVTNSASVLSEGDYIEVPTVSGFELKKLTADATADVSGNITFSFTPPLREAPADNATIRIVEPRVKMRMTSPQSSWSMGVAAIAGMSFGLSEAFAPV